MEEQRSENRISSYNYEGPNGRKYWFAENSLFIFSLHNPVRRLMLRIMLSVWFERFILLLTLFNTVVLGLTDFRHVDTDPNSPSMGLPVMENSWRNKLVLNSDAFLTTVFTAEAIIKIMAMGFYIGDGAYLRDDWNKLDFVITWLSLLVSFPQVPSYTFVRSFRVLRPLRSISIMPGLQRLVLSMLKAIPQLISVIILLFFIFLVFGILGVSFFSGLLHTRCRLTPFPVLRSWDSSLENITQFSCFNLPNMDTTSADLELRSKSPWINARDCYWPFDPSDTNTCTYTHGTGMYKCLNGLSGQAVEDYRYCGSNFDALGNMRFTAGLLDGNLLSKRQMAWSAEWNEDRDFGLTNFDSIFSAFLTIFQTMTGNGWSSVMYRVQNASYPIIGALFFVVLIIFGSFFALNLLLAVLANSFEETKGQEMKEIEEEDLQTAYEMDKIEHAVSYRGPCYAYLEAFLRSARFGSFVTMCILLNTLVLSLDHYPMQEAFGLTLEVTNFVLTLTFTGEMILKLLCFGIDGYCADSLNTFDGTVVVLSLVEFLVAPPSFLGEGTNSKGGVLSVIRSFRLFRVFKLAREWSSMRILLSTIIRTARDMRHFVLLLVLFIYIYALIGMQLFARRFVFDADNYAVPIGAPDWDDPYKTTVPRSNFDDLVSAFTTVFQILSGDNWNQVMYDGYRATGAASFAYFLSLMVFGQFIVMNIFLAILLSNFLNSPMDEDEEASTGSGTAAAAWNPLRIIRLVGVNVVALLRRKQRVLPLPPSSGQKSSASSVMSLPTRSILGFRASRDDEDDDLDDVDDEDEDHHGKRRRKKGSRRPGTGGGGGRQTHTRPQRHTGGRQQAPTSLAATGGGISVGSVQKQIAGCAHHFSLKSQLKVAPVSPSEPQSPHRGTATAGDREGVSSSHNQHDLERYPSSNDTRGESDGKKNVRDSGSSLSSPNQQLPTEAPTDVSTEGGTAHPHSPGGSQHVGPYQLNPHKTLFLFGPQHPVRLACLRLSLHRHFTATTLFLIAISSLLLALDNPLLNPNAPLTVFLDKMDYVLTIFFSIEMAVKIVAHGLCFQSGAYLRDPWNVLDGFVVLVSVVGFTTPRDSRKSLNALRALRSLRALRPLRVIQRAPGLKMVVESLLASIPDVLNVFAVCLVFFLIFSILMVNFFKGQLRACSGDAYDSVIAMDASYFTFLSKPRPWSDLKPSEKAWFGPNSNVTVYSTGTDCGAYPSAPCCPDIWPADATTVTSKMVCLCWGGSWDLVTSQSFDNVGVGLMSLFEMSSRDGWTAVMSAAVDSAGIDMQPQRDNKRGLVIVFIAFMVLGSYLMMNLFVGVILENFTSTKDKNEGGISVLTDEQKAWIKTQQAALRLNPKKKLNAPPHPARAWAFHICESSKFDFVSSACILLNTIVMSMRYFGQSDRYTYTLTYINYAFALFFTVEAILKILAYGKQYFLSRWDLFDFIIMAATNIGLVVMWTTTIDFGSIAMAVRTIRIGRLLRLSRNTKTLNKLFQTLLLTLPGLANIGLLLFLFFFIYALMGVQLFAKVAYNGNVNSNANFQGFWIAMLTLLRFSTGEGWADFTRDMSMAMPGCVEDPVYDPTMCGFNDFPGCRPLNGCGSMAIFAYIISFQLLITFVFINLFIGVILDGFDTADEERRLIKGDHFAVFERLWTEFDPEATLHINVNLLKEFLMKLPPPLGFQGKDIADKEILRAIKRLDLHVYEGHGIHFQDLILAVSKEAMLRETLGEDFLNVPTTISDQLVNRKMRRARRTRSQQKLQLQALQEYELTSAHHAAAIVLQRCVKMRRERTKRRRATQALRDALTYSPSMDDTSFSVDDKSGSMVLDGSTMTVANRIAALGDLEPPELQTLMAGGGGGIQEVGLVSGPGREGVIGLQPRSPVGRQRLPPLGLEVRNPVLQGMPSPRTDTQK